VIDDEESILQLVQEILRREGHKVDSATNGQTALTLIAKRNYDVIISDWKMPGLTGMQIYEDLLASNPNAARQMLFMTGDVIKSTFQDFLTKHDLTCLPKPFSIWEFRAAVARLGTSK
jgi:CheY-like chemotaxis protein